MRHLTRRNFLVLGGSFALGLAGRHLRVAAALPDYEELLDPPTPLGRITTWRWQTLHSEPSFGSKVLGSRIYDDVVRLRATVVGEAPWPSNPTWYLTDGGFIHSAFVQPVRDEPQTDVLRAISPPGIWVQVCVPYTDAYWQPGGERRARRLYYGTVYRAVASELHSDQSRWYRLQEGIILGSTLGPYVPAQSVRQVQPEDLAPLSPGLKDKWILISIGEQQLVCLEDDVPVFQTRVASGVHDRATPLGEFRVFLKRHASRMTGDDYDLPGVAFPVYFTRSGVAIHGTYWHNDYGQRHSHGCVNVTNEAAQWIFRWAEPQVPYTSHNLQVSGDAGTRVVVVATTA